mgnify:CR=1 FL=1
MKAWLLVLCLGFSACGKSGDLPSRSIIPNRSHDCGKPAGTYPDPSHYGWNLHATCYDGIFFVDDIGPAERARVQRGWIERTAELPRSADVCSVLMHPVPQLQCSGQDQDRWFCHDDCRFYPGPLTGEQVNQLWAELSGNSRRRRHETTSLEQ